MATPAFVTAFTATESSGLTVTVSATRNSGEILFVLCAWAVVGTTPTVTWDGTTMTQVGAREDTGGGRLAAWFAILGGSTGTHDVVATFDTGTVVPAALPFTYSNVDSGTPYDGAAEATNSSSTASVTIAGATGDLVIAGYASDEGETISASTGSIRNDQTTTGGAGPNWRMAVVDVASGASVTPAVSRSGSSAWLMLGVNLNASAAGGLNLKIAQNYYRQQAD